MSSITWRVISFLNKCTPKFMAKSGKLQRHKRVHRCELQPSKRRSIMWRSGKSWCIFSMLHTSILFIL